MESKQSRSKEWHIWDFPDNLYVLLKDKVREEFFRDMYKQFGSFNNYAAFLGKKWGNMLRGRRPAHRRCHPLGVLPALVGVTANASVARRYHSLFLGTGGQGVTRGPRGSKRGPRGSHGVQGGPSVKVGVTARK